MVQATSGIDLKKAVDSAVKAAHDYYAGQELHNMLLEEVEMAENKKAWLVTLGFNVPMTPRSGTCPTTCLRRKNHTGACIKFSMWTPPRGKCVP